MIPLLIAAAVSCVPLGDLKQSMPGATFDRMTTEQWRFLEGVSAVMPNTPSGLPQGDGAILAQQGQSARILWTQGQTACESNMDAPKALLDMLNQIAGNPA